MLGRLTAAWDVLLGRTPQVDPAPATPKASPSAIASHSGLGFAAANVEPAPRANVAIGQVVSPARTASPAPEAAAPAGPPSIEEVRAAMRGMSDRVFAKVVDELFFAFRLELVSGRVANERGYLNIEYDHIAARMFRASREHASRAAALWKTPVFEAMLGETKARWGTSPAKYGDYVFMTTDGNVAPIDESITGLAQNAYPIHGLWGGARNDAEGLRARLSTELGIKGIFERITDDAELRAKLAQTYGWAFSSAAA